MMKKVIAFLLISAMLFGLCSCTSQNTTVSHTFSAMDTLMEVTFYGTSEKNTAALYSKLKARTEELDGYFNVNTASSDVSKINAAAKGKAVAVHTDTSKIILKAIYASKLTDGNFDITVYPLTKLWGFTSGKYGVPKDSEIQAALKTVGYGKITGGNTTITKDGAAGVDLGGIAKGYLGGELFSLMNEAGVSGVLSLGGNIVLCGTKPDGKKWDVAVKDPNNTSKNLCTFTLSGGYSVVTSGGYERYFTVGGKTYHHIIDPATGYPAESDLTSVTIIGTDGTMCDAYSTALYVMGEKKAAAFLDKLSDFNYILLTKDKKIYVSSALRNNVKIVDSGTYSFG